MGKFIMCMDYMFQYWKAVNSLYIDRSNSNEDHHQPGAFIEIHQQIFTYMQTL